MIASVSGGTTRWAQSPHLMRGFSQTPAPHSLALAGARSRIYRSSRLPIESGSGQDKLFYSFNLDDHVPQSHLLRGIDRFLDLRDLREHLAPFYSPMGRPSVDPELMIRMLIVGYCFGIRSERSGARFPSAGIAPWSINSFSSRLLCCFGAGANIASMICPPRAMKPFLSNCSETPSNRARRSGSRTTTPSCGPGYGLRCCPCRAPEEIKGASLRTICDQLDYKSCQLQ